MACAGLSHLYFGVFKNIRIIFTYSTFGNYLFCILAGIGGVVFFFFLFQKLPACRILSRIGQNSLFVMCVHYRLLFWMDLFTKKVFGYELMRTRSTIKAVLVGVMLTLLITGFTYIAEQICKKYPSMKKYARVVGLPF